MELIKKNWSIFAVVFLSIFSILPLFQSGFFPIHDNEQVARLFDLEQALIAGHIPPRIVPNLGFGYGYPFFNFYPPLVYYISEIFRLFGFSYIVSVKLMIGLGFILSACFMYLLSKEFFGKDGGVLSSVAYTYVPYRAVDVYVRGAFPEFWAFVFLPLIFWSLFKLSLKYNIKYFAVSVLSMAFLILSHNLITFMASFFIFSWFVFLLIMSKAKKRYVVNVLSSIFISFAITSYFWLPSYFEKQYTMVNLLTSELANYKIHFVCVKQLFNSTWGYGASLPFCSDGLSFEIGKVHLVLVLISSIVLFMSFLRKKTNFFIGIFFIFFVLSIFMTNVRSEFIWDLIQPMWYIQFPWRFLLFSAFFSSLLAGAVVFFPSPKKYILLVIVIVLLIFTNFSYFKPERQLTEVSDINYINKDIIRWDISKLAAEYVPLGIATRKSDIDTTIIDIDKNEIAKDSYTIIDGKIKIDVLDNRPQYKKFLVQANTAGTLRINTYSFPGWKVSVNGNELMYSDDNKLKLITVSIPSGKYILEAKFIDTPIRMVGNYLSLVGIIGFSVFIITERNKKNEQS